MVNNTEITVLLTGYVTTAAVPLREVTDSRSFLREEGWWCVLDC